MKMLRVLCSHKRQMKNGWVCSVERPTGRRQARFLHRRGRACLPPCGPSHCASLSPSQTPNGALAGVEAASGEQAAVLRDERAALHGVADDDGAGDDVVAGSLIVLYW